jgi:hypothetical protein
MRTEQDQDEPEAEAKALHSRSIERAGLKPCYATRVTLSPRVLEGFAVAALAQGDADGALALAGLAPAAADRVRHTLSGLAGASPERRRAFLRGALTRPPVKPEWAERFRASPLLLAYLAQLSRARAEG